jgi:transposase InsO family protein
MKYQFIQVHQRQFAVQEMCHLLHVSSSGYYRWRSSRLGQRAQQDAQLAEQIRAIYEVSQGRYGSPRVHQELQAQGVRCSEKRVARLMREQHLVARAPRKFVVTTDSQHALPVAFNELDREYQVEAVADVNRVWAGDITYVPTAEGWLYVAVVLDLKSRKVIGWGMEASLEQGLVSGALEMALAQRQPQPGLLHHSDRGSQYASHRYQEQLHQQGIVCSMSRRGNCWDNAPVESFFATLKKELVHRENYHTREEAKASLFHYIEVFYNRQRRHSALGYLSPDEYERRLQRQQQPLAMAA